MNLDTVGLETDSQDNYSSKKSVNKAKKELAGILLKYRTSTCTLLKMMNIHSFEVLCSCRLYTNALVHCICAE